MIMDAAEMEKRIRRLEREVADLRASSGEPLTQDEREAVESYRRAKSEGELILHERVLEEFGL